MIGFYELGVLARALQFHIEHGLKIVKFSVFFDGVDYFCDSLGASDGLSGQVIQLNNFRLSSLDSVFVEIVFAQIVKFRVNFDQLDIELLHEVAIGLRV